MMAAKLLLLLLASSLCLSATIAAQQTYPADLDSKCGDAVSGDWEGEFFPGIPKIKYEKYRVLSGKCRRSICPAGCTALNQINLRQAAAAAPSPELLCRWKYRVFGFAGRKYRVFACWQSSSMPPGKNGENGGKSMPPDFAAGQEGVDAFGRRHRR